MVNNIIKFTDKILTVLTENGETTGSIPVLVGGVIDLSLSLTA